MKFYTHFNTYDMNEAFKNGLSHLVRQNKAVAINEQDL